MASEEEILTVFDCYWFEHQIFTKKPPFSTPKPNPVLEIDEKPNLRSIPTRHSRSLSDHCLSSADFFSLKSVLQVHTPKLQTILSGKEMRESSEPMSKQEEFEEVEASIKKTKGEIKKRRRKQGRVGSSSKSLSELEFEELKGFMDLGFVFSEEDKVNSNLVSILPGLQRLGRSSDNYFDGGEKEEEEEEEDEVKEVVEGYVPRPYLSEAWDHVLNINQRNNKVEINQLVDWRIPSLVIGEELVKHHEEISSGYEKSKTDATAAPFMEKGDVSRGETAKKQEERKHSDAAAGMVSENSVRVEERAACNYAKGEWVIDDSWPLYSGLGCKKWLVRTWACRETQRTDFAYEKLRWRLKNCTMAEFTGSKFLERMQQKTIAFVGDSLGQQQFQSLMCMVTGGKETPDVLDVGKEYGLVRTKGSIHPGGLAYRFSSTNTTILYYWSPSLTHLGPLDITNPLTDYAMHLDRPPAFLQHFLPKFDVLVLNTGHHWNSLKFKANRWVVHVGGVPIIDRRFADFGAAKNFTVYSIVHWVDSQLLKYPGLKAFFRTISPRHFSHGDWDTGGTCDNTTPSHRKEVLQDESVDLPVAGAVKGTKVTLIDITALSQLREEGHISRYSIKATPGVQDCLHWCLPGVPDTWNEILFTLL
ncbi:hypothetical protein Vadar_029008 [Vaccinium darrowii]|uniref:Uncharacterized protein n=1 Tax=Vaccinium darrowii TaxID=229202 RepID=A0ACB7XU00_9ERIC|nr:hypothetical protein Vadar_029008 [Vaccinium darrowii]